MRPCRSLETVFQMINLLLLDLWQWEAFNGKRSMIKTIRKKPLIIIIRIVEEVEWIITPTAHTFLLYQL